MKEKTLFNMIDDKVNEMMNHNQMKSHIQITTAESNGFCTTTLGSDATFLITADQWNRFTSMSNGKHFPDAKIPRQLKRWYNENKTHEDVKKLVEKAYSESNGFKKITDWIRTEPNSLAILTDMINGIEYECESLFEVPLKELKSDNGRQFITFENGKFFACAKNNKFKQSFTKNELLDIPFHYRQFARQLED